MKNIPSRVVATNFTPLSRGEIGKCCEITLNFIEIIRNLNRGRDNESSPKQLEAELVSNAKVLAFRIGLSCDDSICLGDFCEKSNGIESAKVWYIDSTDKDALSGDRKFIGLLSDVRRDIEDAHCELVHSNEQHLTPL